MVQPDFDANARVDQPDQGCRHSYKVTRPTVGGTGEAGDVGNQSSTNDEGGLSADDTEGIHCINDVEHGLYVVKRSQITARRDSVEHSRPWSCGPLLH